MQPEDHGSLGGRNLRGWRQVRCGGCGLTEALCICDALPTIVVRTRVIVAMHYIEAVRSTNTGRLAARMLTGASVRVRGARDEVVAETPPGRRLVLFPSAGARPIAASDAGDDLVLVVPDGTWSQARRIARRDVAARGAEHVTLPAVSASAYGLRRGVREGGLCTLEALAVALGVVEGASVEAALHAAFALWHERAMQVRSGNGIAP